MHSNSAHWYSFDSKARLASSASFCYYEISDNHGKLTGAFNEIEHAQRKER